MHFVPAHTRLLKRFLFLLFIYSLLRLGFYFYHLNIYKQFTSGELLTSFLLGIRFDVAGILLMNLSILLLALIPSDNSKFLKFERWLFVVVNMLGFVMAIDDYELFLFMGKRLSFDIFTLGDDILQQLPQIALYYWYFPLLVLLLGVGLYFIDKRYFSLKNSVLKPLSFILSCLILLGLSFVGIRGGLQSKSINIQSAFTQGKNELGHLVLNTPYHFLRTLKNKSLEKVTYFTTDDEAKEIIQKNRKFEAGQFALKKNVVLLILESFSSEYVENGYTPFLSELIKQSHFFPHHLANGRRSIEVLPSVLCGLPSMIGEPLSKSMFSGNKFVCMPKLLKAAGYTNYFFHGGSRGTMGFESYTLSNGFDRYFSRSDYPDKNDFDGTWGIFDEPFMQFSIDEINKMPEPFLAGIFTLSSHQPYSVPEKYHGKFPKGTLEIHESIGYTDYALKQFFIKARTQKWFNNSIFIITADHTSKLESKKFQNSIGQYRVPLLIYDPSGSLSGLDTKKVVQHSDIPRTIVEMLGVSGKELPATSVSVLSPDSGLAMNFIDNREYLMVSGTDVFKISKDGSQIKQKYDWETGEFSSPEASTDPLLKAYLQYYLNGLINNNLSLYR
jgi:phosphoglycerol transferase MdoB-like AlkP superfamily enzyme